MNNLQEIKNEYPEIALGRANNVKGQIFGKGIVPIYRTLNQNTKVRQICTAPCGHYFPYVITELMRKRGLENRSCPICDKEAIDLTNQRFGKLIALYPTNKRSNGHIMQHCKCDCGNETDASISNLKYGSIKSCGCLITETNGYNLMGQRFGKLIVIKDTTKRTNSRNIIQKCQCDCGKTCEVSTSELQSGDTQSCGCIKFKTSHGELKVATLLDENNILYQKQYQIKINNSYRYFDFAVLNTDNSVKYFIEYDGEQHFKPERGQEPLENTQKRDNEKNIYCKENNIPLIRIPYTHYKDFTIEDLLLNSQFRL